MQPTESEVTLRRICNLIGHTSRRNEDLLVDRFVRNQNVGDLANKYKISKSRVNQILRKFWFVLSIRLHRADLNQKYIMESATLSRELQRIKMHNPENITDIIGDNHDCPISGYGFSINTYCLLAEAGIKTIGQLVQKTECEILRIHGLGEKSLHQIKKAIAKHGYALRSEKDE